MRLPYRIIVPTALALAAACSGSKEVERDASPRPTSASCGDALVFKQAAMAGRRQSEQVTVDRARITLTNRASFYAALANVAELKCLVNVSEVDDILARAFAAARVADSTNSEYEMAAKWGEAAYIATEATGLLIKSLPPPGPPK